MAELIEQDALAKENAQLKRQLRALVKRLSHAKETFSETRWRCDLCSGWSPVGAVGPNSIAHHCRCPFSPDFEEPESP